MNRDFPFSKMRFYFENYIASLNVFFCFLHSSFIKDESYLSTDVTGLINRTQLRGLTTKLTFDGASALPYSVSAASECDSIGIGGSSSLPLSPKEWHSAQQVVSSSGRLTRSSSDNWTMSVSWTTSRQKRPKFWPRNLSQLSVNRSRISTGNEQE